MKDKEITSNSSSESWEIVKKTFRERFLAAALLLVAVFAAIQFLPSEGLFFVLQIIIFIALVEFYNLFEAHAFSPYKILGFVL